MLHQHLQPAGAMPAGLPLLALPAEIRAAIKAGAWIVFNVSGGKDSSAAMFAVSIVRPPNDTYASRISNAVSCDTVVPNAAAPRAAPNALMTPARR